jgi:hypothetical protein
MSEGMPGVRKDRRGDALLQKEQIQILRQAASFERYLKSTHHSCSGAPLTPVGTRFEWKRVKKKSAGSSRGRAELHEVVARGRTPDRSNRWACSLWRVCFKRGSKGRRGPLMALIRWKDGRWWPSWRRAFAPAGRLESLSAELRTEARALRDALLKGVACRNRGSPQQTTATKSIGW